MLETSLKCLFCFTRIKKQTVTNVHCHSCCPCRCGMCVSTWWFFLKVHLILSPQKELTLCTWEKANVHCKKWNTNCPLGAQNKKNILSFTFTLQVKLLHVWFMCKLQEFVYMCIWRRRASLRAAWFHFSSWGLLGLGRYDFYWVPFCSFPYFLVPLLILVDDILKCSRAPRLSINAPNVQNIWGIFLTPRMQPFLAWITLARLLKILSLLFKRTENRRKWLKVSGSYLNSSSRTFDEFAVILHIQAVFNLKTDTHDWLKCAAVNKTFFFFFKHVSSPDLFWCDVLNLRPQDLCIKECKKKLG